MDPSIVGAAITAVATVVAALLSRKTEIINHQVGGVEQAKKPIVPAGWARTFIILAIGFSVAGVLLIPRLLGRSWAAGEDVAPGNVLYGPVSGNLLWRTEDNSAWKARERARIHVRDCAIEATTFNPGTMSEEDEGEGSWKVGLGFRIAEEKRTEWFVAISSAGYCWSGGDNGEHEWEPEPKVKLPDGLMAMKKGDKNDLKLIVAGDRALFYLNGRHVLNVDVSNVMDAGEVWLVSEMVLSKQPAQAHSGEGSGWWSGSGATGI